MTLPFKQEKGESAIAWLMCQQYVMQVGNRSMAQVFQANGYDLDEGIKLANKYKWDERADKYDNYRALLDHDGRISCAAVLRKNTKNLSKLLNSHIGYYSTWMNNNQELLARSIETQADCMKLVGAMSRVNAETTDAFIKQENIDLALKELSKELE